MPISHPRVPRLRFSHLGLCTTDLPKMEDFYSRVLGFVITDRGNALGVDLAFLSRDPNEHHQIVLCTGRPKDLPGNTINPMFGPCINQISLALDGLDDLKLMNAHLMEHYADFAPVYANHGTAWSIYFHDPEGNLVETFADTQWYCHQPVFEALDLSKSNAEILTETEALARSGAGFQMAANWRAEIRKEMDAVTAGKR